MPILNYTTSIEAEKTVGEIQKILARAGASAVMSEYDDEQIVSSIAFQIKFRGQVLSYRLPAQIDKIDIILQNDPKVARKLRCREQAARVTWRIIKDWIEAQCALIEAEQAELTEVFLPYMQTNDGSTVYERLESGTARERRLTSHEPRPTHRSRPEGIRRPRTSSRASEMAG